MKPVQYNTSNFDKPVSKSTNKPVVLYWTGYPEGIKFNSTEDMVKWLRFHSS